MFNYWEHNEVEVIDYVTAHLMKQGVRSMRGDTCAYVNRMGLACAAGCLIPAWQYSNSMEGRSWGDVCSAFKLSTMHYELIAEMQCIHDSIPPSSWSEKLAELRSKYSERNSNE
jgi:hypothetical protein